MNPCSVPPRRHSLSLTGLALPARATTVLAAVVGVVLLAPYLVFAVDTRDGRPRAVSEYIAPPLFLSYLAVQTGAVLRRW